MSRMSACGLKKLLARLILAPELLFPLGIFGFQIKISSFFFLAVFCNFKYILLDV